VLVAVPLFIHAFSQPGYEPAPMNAEPHRSRWNHMRRPRLLVPRPTQDLQRSATIETDLCDMLPISRGRLRFVRDDIQSHWCRSKLSDRADHDKTAISPHTVPVGLIRHLCKPLRADSLRVELKVVRLDDPAPSHGMSVPNAEGTPYDSRCELRRVPGSQRNDVPPLIAWIAASWGLNCGP
jgi:hypothetical protein